MISKAQLPQLTDSDLAKYIRETAVDLENAMQEMSNRGWRVVANLEQEFHAGGIAVTKFSDIVIYKQKIDRTEL